MQKQSRFQLRRAAGMYWLFDLYPEQETYRAPLVLNEIGAEIVIQLLHDKNDKDIANALHEKYGISTEEAVQDVQLFCAQLKQSGMQI